jgi:hypothetical protein
MIFQREFVIQFEIPFQSPTYPLMRQEMDA